MNNFFKPFVGIVILVSLNSALSLASLSRPSDSLQVLDTENSRPAQIFKVDKITLSVNGQSLIFKGKRISLAVAFDNRESARRMKEQLEQTKSFTLAMQRGDVQTLAGERELSLARVSADRVLVMSVGQKTWCQKLLSGLGL